MSSVRASEPFNYPVKVIDVRVTNVLYVEAARVQKQESKSSTRIYSMFEHLKQLKERAHHSDVYRDSSELQSTHQVYESVSMDDTNIHLTNVSMCKSANTTIAIKDNDECSTEKGRESIFSSPFHLTAGVKKGERGYEEER